MTRANPSLLISLACVLGFAVILGVACGESRVIAVGGGPPVDDQADGLDGAPPGGELGDDAAGGGKDDGPPATGALREIILLHDTSLPIQLAITEQLLIQAKVIDYSRSGPAEDVLVSFGIVEGPAEGGDATLTATQANTNPLGEVGVTFRANYVANVHYTVELNANGAEPVQLELFVTDAPKGDILVNLVYEGPISVKNVHVRLFPGDYTCGQFNPTNVPANVIADNTLLGLGLESQVVWTDLAAAAKYTIVATAQSPAGSLAAAGCLDGVVVIPAEENTVTLTMFLLTLNPTGTYDTVNVFDFTGAIPGQLGELVDQIVLLFNDPGKFLIDQIKALVSNWIPSWVTDLAFSLFEDQLADIITGWIKNESPDWIQDIFLIGDDLTQIVDHLEMEATLQIAKLQSDYYVQGTLWWTGIALYWHLGCELDPEHPGYDPDCGKFSFGLSDFTNTQFPMDIIEGKFTASIQDFDQFDIDNHTIKINYGKLILFVLNEMVLPALTGEDNLTDAVLSFINCGSIAAAFSNGVLDAIGVEEDDIEGFCVDAITFLTLPVEAVLGNLALDSQLRLTGHGTLIDLDNDLKVDQIIDGTYLGHIEVDGQEGPEFDGFWEAAKQ